ncbi:MAG: flagellar biosynthesis regulator FlaF [Rhodobiaceae bacterium]|nr:flagellar biosynthesis regulator FlaF [Rhodobiaceae bacterium]
MQQAATQAYARTAQATVHPRELEASLLTKAAMRLQALLDAGTTDPSEWRSAIHYNRQLWVIFATSVTSVDNPLPETIKRNVANLSVFIFRKGLEAERKRTAAALKPIIDINREIAAGLRGQA